MNISRAWFGAILASLFLAAAAFATEASPTGTWKWTTPGFGGRPGFEQTLQLELKDGALTGKLLGFETQRGKIPDTAIADASYKDGVVKFSVTRTMRDRAVTSKYDGKLDGDTIKGTIERPGRDGETRKDEWTATRQK